MKRDNKFEKEIKRKKSETINKKFLNEWDKYRNSINRGGIIDSTPITNILHYVWIRF